MFQDFMNILYIKKARSLVSKITRVMSVIQKSRTMVDYRRIQHRGTCPPFTAHVCEVHRGGPRIRASVPSRQGRWAFRLDYKMMPTLSICRFPYTFTTDQGHGSRQFVGMVKIVCSGGAKRTRAKQCCTALHAYVLPFIHLIHCR